VQERAGAVGDGGTTNTRGGRRFLRPVLVVAVIAAVIWLAFGTGLVEHVSDRDRLQATVDDAGVWGPLLFLALMVLLVPLNVPGLLFVIPATTLFGLAGGIVLSLLGGFLACTVGVVAARHLGRAAIESRLPARVQRWESRLSARGFWTVVLLRSCTFLLQPVDWLCGLSSMPMRTVLAGTFVGLIPPTVVIAVSGGGLLDAVL
jgi:uncharacterized membrane protein YdjX (TVP38/TMEM64 family)